MVYKPTYNWGAPSCSRFRCEDQTAESAARHHWTKMTKICNDMDMGTPKTPAFRSKITRIQNRSSQKNLGLLGFDHLWSLSVNHYIHYIPMNIPMNIPCQWRKKSPCSQRFPITNETSRKQVLNHPTGPRQEFWALEEICRPGFCSAGFALVNCWGSCKLSPNCLLDCLILMDSDK